MNHIGHSTPSWPIASPSEKQNCFNLAMKGSRSLAQFFRGGALPAFFLALILMVAAAQQALAVEPIKISRDDVALDLSGAVEIYRNQGENFQVSTAPGADGIVRRIEVESIDERSRGDWAVFALANTTDSQLDRLIVAPHFRLVGSGLIWPDLGSDRIAAITPSEGFALDQQQSADADVFLVTLNPGAVVTFVAELASPKLPQIYLWEPEAYKDTINSYTLFRGIVIGIAGLLALFLTILFVVKGTSMFPATAALAWAALAYISVDFGFLSEVIEVTPGNEQIWRAGTEVALAATLVVFLFTYLNLNRWHDHFSYGALVWVFGLFLIFGVAIFDPAVASGIARLSLGATAVVGLGLIAYLGMRGYDRAIMLVPSWLMILAWTACAWMTVVGTLDNDIVQPALGGGLILIILLIGFTVMQHAFSGGVHQGLFSDLERQALAVTGAGDIVWDWDVLRDRVITRPDVSEKLGLEPNSLHGPARNWLPVLHHDDRDMFRSTLDVVLEHRRGRIAQCFRLRGADGHHHWFALKARPVIGSDGEIIRCVGTLVDVTEEKKAEERLMHDAVHDHLTGLPNRQLFLNRLDAVISIGQSEEAIRPTVFVIDIDRFKQVNDSLGISAGDTMLLTIARRLHRLLKPHDALSRISGDQFALMLLSERDPARIAAFADAVKQAVRAPITYAKREIVLTAAIGLITWTSAAQASGEDMLKDAELAMQQAKRFGGDRIEPFRPAFRSFGSDRLQLESDLRRALDRGEFKLVYQAIVRLEDRSVAGFEALLRWEHPRKGTIPPAEFIPVAESCGLIVMLGLFAMQRAADDLAAWQRQIGDVPLSVSVNLSSRQLLRRDLVSDVRSVIARSSIKARCFRLELTESLVMDNPEQATHVLAKLRDLGIGLSLDDFGTGYSSLSYLTRFPFDTIKIDKSFIDDSSPKKPVLLNSMINMAHDLGMSVVAEGVSDEKDALQLRQMGCEYVQSFLFGAPIAPELVLRLLKEQYPLAQA
jgi:diguanylate cyclase (GGDEF)-like protein/PAS domain S-box-containing protein